MDDNFSIIFMDATITLILLPALAAQLSPVTAELKAMMEAYKTRDRDSVLPDLDSKKLL